MGHLKYFNFSLFIRCSYELMCLRGYRSNYCYNRMSKLGELARLILRVYSGKHDAWRAFGPFYSLWFWTCTDCSRLTIRKKMLTWKRKRIYSKQQTDVSSPPPYAFWQMLFKTTAWPLWQNKTCPHLHRNLKKRWVKLWRELRQMNIRNYFYSPIFCGTSGKKALNLLQVNYCVPYRLINGGLGLTRDADMSVFAA